MPVSRSQIDATTLQLASEKGFARLSRPSELVVVTEFVGYLERELLPFILEQLAEYLRRGRIHAFHDWSAMTGYDSQARVLCTRWLLSRRNAFSGNTMLVGSKLVSMGVSVANLALGPDAVRSFQDRGAFEAAIERALADDDRTTGADADNVRRTRPRTIPIPHNPYTLRGHHGQP